MKGLRLHAAAMLSGTALLTAVTPAAAQIATAQVTGGTVEGSVADGLSTFKGIPFAAPPVGALRWKGPQPIQPWRGVRAARSFGPACMQEPGLARQMGYEGRLSEDCLYLDVWTPAKSPAEKLPVMVWIYGGGFFSGMTSIPLYNGANFARQGVVFVSLGYRVGPFGFMADPALSTESGHGSGTYGLQDMIAGLKWVQDNVAKFGGDPGRVTIIGHSAGAYAVSMLAGSPLAKGLFTGAIAESGASFAPAHAKPAGGSTLWTLGAAEAQGQAFLASMGVHDLASARALSAAQIEAAADAKGAPRFLPPVDHYVLPGDPVTMWKAGRFNDTPILIGSTSDEAAAFGAKPMTPQAFEAEVRKDYGAKADAMLTAYPHATPSEATLSAKQLRRDSAFGWPAWTWAKLQSDHGKGKTYLYYFDRPSARDMDGSGHGSEIALVFDNPDHRPGRAAWTGEDHAISARMQRYWVNFATTGNPNGPGLPTWPAFTAADERAMLLGADFAPVAVPNLAKLKALGVYYDWLRDQGGQ